MVYGSSTVTLGTTVLNTTWDSGARVIVQDLTGDGSTGSTYQVTQKPRSSGGWGGDAFATSRLLQLKVLVISAAPELHMQDCDRLIGAVSLQDTTIRVKRAGGEWWTTVRRAGATDPTHINSWMSQFQVQVEAADWRKFGDALTAQTGLPSSSGGLTFPHTIPYKFDSQVVSGQLSLVNPGNAPGTVIARIDGPGVGPKITHVSTGRALVFSSMLTLKSDEFLIVDMEKHTAMLNGLVSRSGWIDRRGWSSFDPGQNIWSFASTGADQGAKLTITATPASQ